MCVEINTTRSISAQFIRHRSIAIQEFCLAGDTKISVQPRNGVTQQIPIKELYKKWSNPRFTARFARSYDSDLQRFLNAPILSVYSSGEKDVYEFEIKTEQSKKTIRCTREHKVLTKERGFVDFGTAFDENLTIACNGKEAEPLLYQQKEVLEENAWMGSTAYAKMFGIAEVTARKWFRKQNVSPFNPNNVAKSNVDPGFKAKLGSFMKWARKNVLKECCEYCGHTGEQFRLELSHIQAHDENPALAFDENNLQTLCSKCHRRHDIDVQGKKYGWSLALTAKWGKISGQTYLGVQETFDIEMDHPTHNFVANGIVVHNSQRYSDTTLLGSLRMPHLRRQDLKNRQNSIDDLDAEQVQGFYRRIATQFEEAEHLYQEMISSGIAKECAREILPMAAPTRIYANANIRSWITYIALREKSGTQAEHMAIAKDIKTIFCGQLPNIAEALGGADVPWEL